MKKNIWSNRNFLLYFVGQTVSSLGDGFYLIGFVWLSMQLSGGKGIVMGGVLSIYTIGELVFGLIAGPIVDRFDRKKILIVTDIIRGFIVFFLFIITKLSIISLLHLYLCVALFSVFSPIFHRAEFAVIPQLVEKDDLLRANGLLAGSKRLMQILAPALAGAYIGFFGIAACFLFDTLSFLFSTVLTTLLSIQRIMQGSSGQFFKQFMTNFGQGYSFLIKSSFLLGLGIYAACINFFAGPIFPLLPLLSNRIGIGVSGYGIIMGGLSGGMIAASFLIVFVNKKINKITIMLCGLMISAIAIISISVFNNFLLIISTVILGIGLNITNIPITTLFQQEIPQERIGVVSSFVFTIAQIAMPVSMLLSGVLVDIISIELLFTMIGLIVFIGAIVGFFLPTFRKYHMREEVLSAK